MGMERDEKTWDVGQGRAEVARGMLACRDRQDRGMQGRPVGGGQAGAGMGSRTGKGRYEEGKEVKMEREGEARDVENGQDRGMQGWEVGLG